MQNFNLRQLSLLTLVAGMVALGVLELAEFVTPSPVLAATLLSVILVLSFDLGRQTSRIW